MVFDTNFVFKIVPFVWGTYDGEKFVQSGFLKTTVPYLWTRFWWIFTIYDFLRYSTLSVLPPSKHGSLEYYLCDYGSAIKGKPYRLMITLGPLYNIWMLCVMFLFHQMMYSDKRYRYWLKFFQLPKTRTLDELELAGYSREQLAKFWELSSSFQNIYWKTLFAQAAPAMTIGAVSYLFVSQKYSYLHSASVFWTILIINFVSLVSIGTMNLLIILGPIVYLFFICKIMRERFAHVTEQLKGFICVQKPDAEQVDKCLHDFDLLIDDLQRSNFFWSKYLSFGYHIGLAICSILFLCGLYSEDIFMISFSAILFVMTGIPTLVICVFLSGDLHNVIRKAYHPMTNLLANKQLKFPTTVRIVRILDFINSEHAGIRCASFFLIRKDIALHLFLELLANVILLQEMLYYISS